MSRSTIWPFECFLSNAEADSLGDKMTGPQKTLTDIWNEVQKEQRQFNKIVRYMMTALIVTALVVGAGVLMSWFKLNNLSSTYQQSIAEAEAQVAISRSTSISNRQTINAQLLRLAEGLE